MAGKIVNLDVREILQAGEDPFEQIMTAVAQLGAEDILELHATFQPQPLIRMLGKRGYNHSTAQEGSNHFIVQFYKESTDIPCFHLDNRDLEPPQPMVRTLEFLDAHAACQAGELSVEIWNVRVPALLLPELEERGYRFFVDDSEEGMVRVKIFKAR